MSKKKVRIEAFKKITKSTTLVNTYATTGPRGFCFDRDHANWNAHTEGRGPIDCRTFPEELLPEGTIGRRGQWTITVVFEPTEEPKTKAN